MSTPIEPDGTGEAPTYAVKSMDNALRTLLMFQASPSLRLTDVATALGVGRSTAHRLLAMLEFRGFVTRDAGSKAYRAGGALVELAVSAASFVDVRELARPHLERLRNEVGETVHLMMLEGPTARFVDGVEGPQGLRVGSRTGLRIPAYSTSGGKVLLAQLDPAVVAALYPRGLRAITPETLTDRETLNAELQEVRERGYATNFGESELRVSGVAVCVVGPGGGPIAAVTVAAPAERLTTRDAIRVAAQVTDAARRVAASIGGARLGHGAA